MDIALNRVLSVFRRLERPITEGRVYIEDLLWRTNPEQTSVQQSLTKGGSVGRNRFPGNDGILNRLFPNIILLITHPGLYRCFCNLQWWEWQVGVKNLKGSISRGSPRVTLVARAAWNSAFTRSSPFPPWAWETCQNPQEPTGTNTFALIREVLRRVYI